METQPNEPEQTLPEKITASPVNGEVNEYGETYQDGYWLPASPGLLNRSTQLPTVGADRIRSKVFDSHPITSPEIAHQAVVVTPPKSPVITAQESQQRAFKEALFKLSQRYENKHRWKPRLDPGYGLELLATIFEQELARMGRTPIQDPVDVDMLYNLFLYHWRHPSCPWDLDRCLLVYGNVGIGKTFVWDCIQILLSTISTPPVHQLRVVPIPAMMSEVAVAKSFKPLQKYRDGDLVFDELGMEDRTAVAYGDRQDAFGELLNHRHRQFVRNDLRTHFITNLAPDELGQEEWYGTRLGDRFYEWVQCIHYDCIVSKRPKK